MNQTTFENNYTGETMDSTKIAVVMATFNGARYLANQLDSILNQSRKPDRIVICDDRSTDGTVELVKKFQISHPEIQLISQPENVGINENFRTAINAANCDYIFISDQDDIWHQNKIATMLQVSEAADLVYSDAAIVDAEGRQTHSSESAFFNFEHVSGTVPEYFLFNNCISGHNMMIRRDFAERALKHPIPEAMLYDQWLGLVASLGNGIKFLDKPLCNHRIHASNSNNNLSLKKKKKSSRKIDYEMKVQRSRDLYARLDELAPDSSRIKAIVRALNTHFQTIDSCWFNFQLFADLRKIQQMTPQLQHDAKETRKLFKLSVGRRLWWLRYI